MLIDRQSLRDSRWWIIISLVLLLGGSIWYFIYAARVTKGVSGGSIPGLAFGIAGTAIIVFAWALTLRKAVRSWRIGKAYTWLQGHVYLSIVSYPLILYHAGFRWGGPLTSIMMWAFTACYFSGIILLILQQLLPKILLDEVPLETIYEQINEVARRNLLEADALIEQQAAVGVAVAIPNLDEDEPWGTPTATTPGDLKAFYDKRVRPWLAHDLPETDRSKTAMVLSAWGNAFMHLLVGEPEIKQPAAGEFTDIRRKTPVSVHEVIETLEQFCEERRQFKTQRRLQHVLHGWLLLHVPASWVMVVLLPIHTYYALRYSWLPWG